MTDFTIEPMTARDWPEVRAIFEEGIKTENATFDAGAASWEAWDADHAASPRFVARAGEKVIGWVALSPVSGRRCFAGVAEVSVYVADGHRGQGVGRTLLEKVIEASERAGFWTLQAGIFPENRASLSLHARCGFTEVGRRKRIGAMPDGRWRDIILLERRSARVGPG